MKKQLRLFLLALMSIILLTGCNILGKQDNIKLSAEYEALCNSKNTKNKQLCRETMNQLPKFENDVNTYFKEKFGIGDFVLTGINFPYESFDHGGFNATFQLKEKPSISFFGTFDYRDNKYELRAFTNISKEDTARTLLASAVLLQAYGKTLELEHLQEELEFLNVVEQQEGFLFGTGITPLYGTKKFFMLRSFLSTFTLSIDNVDEIAIVDSVKNKEGDYSFNDYVIKYYSQLEKTTISIITKQKNKEEAIDKYKKYSEYLGKHKNRLSDVMYYCLNDSKEIHYITKGSGGVLVDGEKQ